MTPKKNPVDELEEPVKPEEPLDLKSRVEGMEAPKARVVGLIRSEMTCQRNVMLSEQAV